MRSLFIGLLCSTASVVTAHNTDGVGCDVCDTSQRSHEAFAFADQAYRRVDSLAVERRFRDEITFSEARITSLRRQISEFDRINRFGAGNALALSADRARLDLLREERIQRDLREQLLIAQRSRRNARQVHAYAVDRELVTRTRAAVQRPGSITIVNH